MAQFSERELQNAFHHWRREYPFSSIDEEVMPYLNSEIISGKMGWLKKTRRSLFLSLDSVAKKMSISRTAFGQLEEREAEGRITIEHLAKAAEAMDCELVYAIRPKKRKTFSQTVWQQILPIVLKHPWLKACDKKRQSQALASIARDKMTEAKFRRDMGWSRQQ